MTRGGVWRHLQDLAHGLRDAGFSVTIGLLPAAEALRQATTEAGLPWRPLPVSIGPTTDVWHVHLHDTYDRVALAALAARRPFGPAIITEHLPRSHASDERLEPQHPRHPYAAAAKTAFKRFQFGLVDSVIAVGASSARFIEERYHPRPGLVTVVRNGIDIPPQPPSPPALGRTMRVVSVGSLGRQKGHDVLIEALFMARMSWNVTIVGTGSQLDRLRARAAGLPPDRLQCTGWVDDPEPLVRAADVVCMPSRWESFPYAALESAALGRPLVASQVDGLDEIVVHGETGLLVAPDDPGQLAAALDRLAGDAHLVAEYGRRAQERVARLYTRSRMVSGVVAEYERAMGRAPAASGLSRRDGA